MDEKKQVIPWAEIRKLFTSVPAAVKTFYAVAAVVVVAVFVLAVVVVLRIQNPAIQLTTLVLTFVGLLAIGMLALRYQLKWLTSEQGDRGNTVQAADARSRAERYRFPRKEYYKYESLFDSRCSPNDIVVAGAIMPVFIGPWWWDDALKSQLSLDRRKNYVSLAERFRTLWTIEFWDERSYIKRVKKEFLEKEKECGTESANEFFQRRLDAMAKYLAALREGSLRVVLIRTDLDLDSFGVFNRTRTQAWHIISGGTGGEDDLVGEYTYDPEGIHETLDPLRYALGRLDIFEELSPEVAPERTRGTKVSLAKARAASTETLRKYFNRLPEVYVDFFPRLRYTPPVVSEGTS